MKNLILLFFPFCLFSQTNYDAPIRVDVRDTFEVAYRSYSDGLVFGYSKAVIEKDSIGIDSFTMIRLYWIDPNGKRNYLELVQKQYKNKMRSYYDYSPRRLWLPYYGPNDVDTLTRAPFEISPTPTIRPKNKP